MRLGVKLPGRTETEVNRSVAADHRLRFVRRSETTTVAVIAYGGAKPGEVCFATVRAVNDEIIESWRAGTLASCELSLGCPPVLAEEAEVATFSDSGEERMNMHRNARLTPLGREGIVRQVESGQTPEAVAEAAR